MRKNYFVLFILFFSAISFGQAIIYSDYFDAYTVGGKLACQDSVNWTTWSNDPCGNEDAFINNAQSSSISNSVVIMPNNDLVKPIANYNSGNYSVVFKFYLPEGKSGYFNVLSLFVHNTGSQWAFECFLNPDSTGRINAGGNNAASFTFTPNTWHTAEVRANMADTNDVGSFYIDGVNIHTWAWSTGATGSSNLKQLGGVNFYGGEPDNEFYVDNFQIWDNLAPVGVEDHNPSPADFTLSQNYPNPFNPSTRIFYSLPKSGYIKLSVFNSLGEEIAILAEGYRDAGTYGITYDALQAASGTYFYKLQSDRGTITKKMLLIK